MNIRKKAFAFVIALAMVATMIPFASAPADAAGAFEIYDDVNAFEYDKDNCPGTGICEASQPIVSASSSDEKVFQVNTGLPYKYYTESDPEWNYTELGEDCKCEIIPMGEGTATLTLKNEAGETATKEVTVKKDYFAAFLNSRILGESKAGIIHFKTDMSNEEYEVISNTSGYGKRLIQIYSRYGTKVSLKFKGKTYKKTTGTTGIVDFIKPNKLYKLKTKGTFTIKLGPASVTKSFKIVSDSTIDPTYIAPKAKKGAIKIDKVHKGDYLRIKIGKKTVKKASWKKGKTNVTVKFKNKKKMKKNTKVKAYLYNKYKQRLATMTYKVGTEVYEY